MVTDPLAPSRGPSTARRRAAAVAGDLFAAFLIIGAAFAPFDSGRPDGVIQHLVVMLPAALLPFRRRWPIPVLAACVALYGAAALAGILSPGIVLAAAIAMFGVANRSDRRRTLVVAAVTIGTIVGLSILAAIGGATDPVIQIAAMMAFAAAAGDATRSRRAVIVAVTERAERAEQTREAEARRRVSEERLRIARDLHDVVAHQISVISLNAGVASSLLHAQPERAEEALGAIRSASRTVLGEIGDLMTMLRADDTTTTVGPQLGLDALDGLVAEFASAGLDVRVRVERAIDALPATVDVVAYRVVQEGLTNALKHGAEGRAHVLVSVVPGRVEIVVTNPTNPTTPAGPAGPAVTDADGPPSTAGGYGLLGLRERVSAVRGTVVAGPAAGGFRLAAAIPTSTDDHSPAPEAQP